MNVTVAVVLAFVGRVALFVSAPDQVVFDYLAVGTR